LVKGQVSCTHDTKIFIIALNASKAFLAHHLSNENGGHVEIMTRWWTSSSPCVLPTFETSLNPLSTMLVLEAPWITYFSLSQRVLMTTSKIVVSLDKWLGKRCFYLKCHSMGQQMGLIWWGTCNLVVICRIFGWCLIISNVFKNGPPWLVMFMTLCTTKCSPLQFATCNLNPQKLSVSCGQN